MFTSLASFDASFNARNEYASLCNSQSAPKCEAEEQTQADLKATQPQLDLSQRSPNVEEALSPFLFQTRCWLGKIRTAPKCETVSKPEEKPSITAALRLFMLPAVVCQFIPQVDAPLSSAVCYLKTTFTFIFLWGAIFEKVISSYIGMCLTTFGHCFALKDTYIILAFLDVIFM